MRICSVEGCGARHEGLGYCRTHYRRFKSNGSPELSIHSPKLRWIMANRDYHGDDCLIWPFFRGERAWYGSILIDGVTHSAGHVMLSITKGPPPTPKHEAAHNCGNGCGGCVNPRHLRWATRSENHADKIIHGTTNRGERHGINKYSQSEIEQIAADIRSGMKPKDVADKYSISRPMVSNLKSGRIWGWLTGFKREGEGVVVTLTKASGVST